MTKQERIDVYNKAKAHLLAMFPNADSLSNDVEWELMKPLAEGKATTAKEVIDIVKEKVDVIEITACGGTNKVVYLPDSKSSDFITPYPFPNHNKNE